MAAVVALTAAALLLGLAGGWEAHHLRTRGLVLRLNAAATGITDRRLLADVVAHYARLLGITLPRRTR